ncbi:unnamed protein product [Symbiodinium microadriaticum]|nr:unnamed protein product [Symbiodinium microadriaticum]
MPLHHMMDGDLIKPLTWELGTEDSKEKRPSKEVRSTRETFGDCVIWMEHAAKELQRQGVKLGDIVLGYAMLRNANLSEYQENQLLTWGEGGEPGNLVGAQPGDFDEDDEDDDYVYIGEGEMQEMYDEEHVQFGHLPGQDLGRCLVNNRPGCRNYVLGFGKYKNGEVGNRPT